MKIARFASSLVLLASFAPNAALAQGGVTRFCTPGAAGSRISAAGSADFTVGGGSGDLVLHASNVPAGNLGVFFYGGSAIPALPLGNGFRCVGGPLFRLPAVTAAPGNALVSPVDYLQPPSPAGAILPGSTWNFQCWFRSAGTVDLSDAIEVRFVPPEPFPNWSTYLFGQQSGHPLAQNLGGVATVTSAPEWNSFWQLHTQGMIPPPPRPPFDFSQESIVAVFAGRRMSSGFSIEVERLRLSVATMEVRSRERAPGAGCAATFGERHPFHFVRVPHIEHLTPGAWTPTIEVYTCP